MMELYSEKTISIVMGDNEARILKLIIQEEAFNSQDKDRRKVANDLLELLKEEYD